jgi:replicative DNA helicase
MPRDYERMKEVIADIKAHYSVPGVIDVQQMFSWQAIVDYYEANKEKMGYAVIIVDYFGRMDVEGNFRTENDRKAAREETMRGAFNWAKREQVVLISPFQVNRAAHKEAKRNEGAYDLDALFGSSVAQQDIDLVISLFRDDELTQENKVMVQCEKYRDTEKFQAHVLVLDKRTNYLYDPRAAEIEELDAIARMTEAMEHRQGGKNVSVN